MKSIYDFNSNSKSDWKVIDDGVMGGLSQGKMTINEDGHGVFSGHVSLENNGGFSSVMHQLYNFKVGNAKKIVLKIKGDKKAYQFRLKANNSDAHSFIQTFETNGDWQEIKIPLNSFYASYRGRKLDMPNFSSDQLAEIRFLIAKKRNRTFN